MLTVDAMLNIMDGDVTEMEQNGPAAAPRQVRTCGLDGKGQPQEPEEHTKKSRARPDALLTEQPLRATDGHG